MKRGPHELAFPGPPEILRAQIMSEHLPQLRRYTPGDMRPAGTMSNPGTQGSFTLYAKLRSYPSPLPEKREGPGTQGSPVSALGSSDEDPFLQTREEFRRSVASGSSPASSSRCHRQESPDVRGTVPQLPWRSGGRLHPVRVGFNPVKPASATRGAAENNRCCDPGGLLMTQTLHSKGLDHSP